LVLAFAAAAVIAVVAVAVGNGVLTVVGLAIAVALAGIVAAYLIVAERRRHEAAEQELTSEARFLESLVETMGSIAGDADVLERTREEAERLFEARALLLAPGERPRRAPAENAIVIPLRAHDEEVGALRLTRARPFDRDDVVRATVLADFAAREHENAQLLEEAQLREVERTRLSNQIITAEQDERRRLANELHDGAVQALSGVALLLDAGLNSIAEGRRDEARQIIGGALERHRATIGQLRNLSFNLEPVVLRDQGFAPAVRALTDQVELAHGKDAGGALPDHPRGDQPGRAAGTAADAGRDDARDRRRRRRDDDLRRCPRRAPPAQPRGARGARPHAERRPDRRPAPERGHDRPRRPPPIRHRTVGTGPRV